jgi:hypothetical protein
MDNDGRTKKFLSLPLKSLCFKLKAAFLKAFINSKTTRVSYRLQDVKYNEESPIILLDINECHGVHIGDIVDILKEPYGFQDGSLFWDEQPNHHPFSKSNRQQSEPSIITGFLKLEGHIKGESKARIETIFCTVAPTKNLFLWISEKMALSEGCILRATSSATPISDPLLLFWVEGLEKISDYQHKN